MFSSPLASRIITSANMMMGSLYPLMKVAPEDFSSRTVRVIVTGANTGIGLECARKLAGMGAEVVIACRDLAKGEAARQDILASDEHIVASRVSIEVLDLGDGDSIKDFVKRWDGKPLDILLNNAGMTSHTYRQAKNTAAPYELMYYTDILSHIQLTLSLLPCFTTNSRIVNVASIAQYEITERIPATDLTWLEHIENSWGYKFGDEYTSDQSKQIYYRVKFLQVVFTKVLQQRLNQHPQYQEKNISVYVCNPGLVKTQMYTRPDGAFGGELSSADKNFMKMVDTISISAEQGACTPVYLAVSQDAVVTSEDGKGAYYDRMTKRTPNGLIADAQMGDEIWNEWMRQVGLEGVQGL